MRTRSKLIVLLACLVVSCGAPRGDAVITPSRGDARGGVEVRIQGAGFRSHGTVALFFGQRAAKGVVVESDTLLRAITPPADEPGAVPVTLHFGDGARVEVSPAFEQFTPEGITITPADDA
ncbi:MAG: IPT/TIG domain-containing protein [Myxococcales bacterium]|nr:IPT/TIG domain-containing protein [Myxococcales bacterium]